MRLEARTEAFTHVVLSKRNVSSLLHKVDVEWSHKTLTYTMADGHELIVTVEPDEVHYVHRERDVPGFAGAVHPATEAFINECKSIDPLGHCVLPYGHPGECFMDGEINA